MSPSNNPLSSPYNLPNDVVNHDLLSEDYWRTLSSLNSYVFPLRQWEIDSHGRLDRHEVPSSEVEYDYYELASEGIVPIKKLPGMSTPDRVHTVKRILRPMDTGVWDPNRQYLQDGSINFFGW